MSNSNYPAGVTDNHPHFNPPAISASAVECGADEALVLPNYWVQLKLNEILNICHRLDPNSVVATELVDKIDKVLAESLKLSATAEYECPFNDEVDLEESECARWDCPVCGNERETDTLPEERDPDEEWERRGEGR